ncbi:MAG: hypothetical protein NTU53_03015, partial [Planctomycetota bacterium]|nr:hypothetical protein [Planctomycetota bacterium]
MSAWCKWWMFAAAILVIGVGVRAGQAAGDDAMLRKMVEEDWGRQEQRLGRKMRSAEAIGGVLERTGKLLENLRGKVNVLDDEKTLRRF